MGGDIYEPVTPEEEWARLGIVCKECFRRKVSCHPIRPDCSDRDCPPDLLKRDEEE